MAGQSSFKDVKRQRELMEIQYVAALDGGDWETVAAILQRAVEDPELDRQLASIDLTMHKEAGLLSFDDQAREVRGLLLRHLPSAVPEPEAPGELTVGMVALRLAEESTGRLAAADRMANLRLFDCADPLPSPVTTDVIARLASQLDIAASQRYWELFRRTAAMLAISRQRNEVELAAARRQSRGRRASVRRHTPRRGSSHD